MHPQIPLDLDPDQLLTFDTFWAGGNQLLVEVLGQFASRLGHDTQMYINGSEGSGKTHLLSATCQLATEQGYRIAYMSADWIQHRNALQGYEQFDLVCIDNLHLLPAGLDSEMALFNLVNDLRQSEGRLLFSANCASAQLKLELPDLRTRLVWGASFVLVKVPDDEVAQALNQRALYLGVNLPDEVSAYLLARFPRDFATQVQLLLRLNTASLQAQRKITVPFAREILSPQE